MSRLLGRSLRLRQASGRPWCLVAGVAAALLLTACHSTNPQPQAEFTQGSPYTVGPPDDLVITVLPEPIIQRNVTVRPDGMISVDLVGDVPAAGRTTQEIAEDIERRISRFKRDAVVTVALGAALSPEITVLGEVRRPSTFPLSRETRLIEAVGLVGGPKPFASKRNVRIIRVEDGHTRIYKANLSAIEQGDLSTNMMLKGGDLVIVPPTILARVGYFMEAAFYPVGYLLGMGSQVSTTVVTGGTNRSVNP